MIGLLVALELGDRGREVVVYDAPLQRPCASWAGGGILSPLFPWRYDDAVNALCRQAVARYRQLAERIVDAGGPDPDVMESGMLVLTDDAPQRVRDWCDAHHVRAECVSAASRLAALPDTPAWWLPQMASVRNSALLTGLDVLLRRRGVCIVQREVVALVPRPHDVQVKLADGDDVAAREVVVAAGAWSASLLAPLGVRIDVRPVKGEMLLFEAPALAPACMVLTEHGYLIPRGGGRLLAGSTLEPDPADVLPSRAACARLHRMAAALIPGLGDVAPVAQWAGWRPGTARAAPLIDRVDEHVWLATGHFRNGLVAAPGSARLLAALMCGEPAELDPRPYSVSS